MSFIPIRSIEKIKYQVFNQKDINGFTLVELIVVVMMIGILSSIAMTQFMTAADKAKQKEATAIVASMIKAATAFNTEYGSLPEDMGDMSEYARFQRCVHPDAAKYGSGVCKNHKPEATLENEKQFFSSSGNYWIELKLTDEKSKLKITAKPAAGAFRKIGSGVTGCYNPAAGISRVEEKSAKTEDRGFDAVKDPEC